MDDQQTKLKTAKRYRYTEIYKMTVRTGPDGSVTEVAEYIGAYLCATHSEEQYRKYRLFAAADAGISLCAVLALLLVRGYSVYQGGMYVFIPITASLIPMLYLILGMLKLPKEDRKLQEDVYRFAHVRIRRSGVGIAMLLLAAAVFTLVFFLSSGTAFQPPDILFFALLLIPAVMNLMLFRKTGKLKYEKT